MHTPISTAHADHYVWAGTCDGWHLARSAALSVIEERMPPGASRRRLSARFPGPDPRPTLRTPDITLSSDPVRMASPHLPRHVATRYVQPLREGGSLPAVVDTEDGGLYVVKFRGAGQGAKVLVAELVVGLIAAHLGLPVPELAVVEIGDRFGRSEPDPEIQDLLRKSHGTNVAARYLEGAFNFDGVAAGDLISPELAARVVWLDAFTTNPDRTPHNPNLLVWQRRPWLIDHGAALYAHHDWGSVDEARTVTSFPLIRSHVLLAAAGDIAAADADCAGRLSGDVIGAIVDAVPDELYLDHAGTAAEFASAGEARERYRTYLTRRLLQPRAFATEAIAAQGQVRREPPRHLSARR